MKLHTLVKNHKKSQRVGRGGKRGTTAGRGTKGQRSRAGHRIRPAERDLILRLPKHRGFRNKPLIARRGDVIHAVNVGDLAAKLKTYAKDAGPLEIDIVLMKTAGLLGKNFKGRVKILGDGEITFPISVKGMMVSENAKKKIENAKGVVH